jgi:uncharacterized protein YukE
MSSLLGTGIGRALGSFGHGKDISTGNGRSGHAGDIAVDYGRMSQAVSDLRKSAEKCQEYETTLKKMRSQLEGALEGEARKALLEKCDKMSRFNTSMENEYRALASKVQATAEALREAEQQLARLNQGL